LFFFFCGLYKENTFFRAYIISQKKGGDAYDSKERRLNGNCTNVNNKMEEKYNEI